MIDIFIIFANHTKGLTPKSNIIIESMFLCLFHFRNSNKKNFSQEKKVRFVIKRKQINSEVLYLNSSVYNIEPHLGFCHSLILLT